MSGHWLSVWTSPGCRRPVRFRMGQSLVLQRQIDMLLVLYSTAFIRHWETPDAAEIAWEQEGLDTSQPGSRVALADICPSFTAHLKTHFGLPTGQFAPYTSSILVDDPAFVLQEETVVRTTLQAYGIPLDADVVLAFGRAAPIKGFEQLIPALAPLRDRMHFVLISVPYIDDDSQQRVYDRLLQQHAIRATHIKAFTRDLPRALCQWPRTKIVVVPSRQETFSNIPLEVALWAREKGPVMVASTAGGFVDQIEPGTTGFLVDISSRQAHHPDAAPGALISPRRPKPTFGIGRINGLSRPTTSKRIFWRPSVGFGRERFGARASVRAEADRDMAGLARVAGVEDARGFCHRLSDCRQLLMGIEPAGRLLLGSCSGAGTRR